MDFAAEITKFVSKDTEKNKPFALVSNSKRKNNFIVRNILEVDSTLKVNSSTMSSQEVQEFLKNPSEKCKDFYGLAFTSCIDAGTDINSPSFHFTMFCYFTNRSTQPDNCIQMTQRIHDLIRNENGNLKRSGGEDISCRGRGS